MGGEVGKIVLVAEPGEVFEVGSVGAEGGGGLGGVDVGSRLFDQVFEVVRMRNQ